MRLHFPTLVRPKKAAKKLSKRLGIPLAKAHSGIAQACGYRDWHDFEKSHAAQSASPLDQYLSDADFYARQVSLSLALADALSIPDGDAQYALENSKLSGDRQAQLSDQVAIRLGVWRSTVLPLVGRRERGAIGRLKSPGRNGEIVILRTFGKPTRVVTQKNVGMVADFEYVSPRNPPPLFLPVRLYLPYGYWVEPDGSKVLFSRDYKPMWRIRDGFEPERVEPWLGVRHQEEKHLWEGISNPWSSDSLRLEMEDYLASHRIFSLPIWADILPVVVHNDAIGGFSEAVKPLRSARAASRLVA